MAIALLVSALGLFGLLVITLWIVVYQIMRQQGRLLLRVERLEELLSTASGKSFIPIESMREGLQNPIKGLEVGSTFPPFQLSDLGGNIVDIETFDGKRRLIVNWDPQCHFCTEIAPDLADLQANLRKQSVELLLISRGDIDSNVAIAAQNDLACPILLHQEGGTLEAFDGMGTPVAYLLVRQPHL